MLEGSLVVVIVPAFQEEAHVGRVVASMPAFVDHVVVVDDGSTDATSARAREAAVSQVSQVSPVSPGQRGGAPSPRERVRVVRHAARRGVGAAIATGYREALALGGRPTDALCVMAGDGQMEPNELARVARPIARGEADVV
jgi:glycosyltransferase involved in cell wall biosynthesis